MTRFDATLLVAQTLAAQAPGKALAERWRGLGEDGPLVLEIASEQRVATALYTRLLALDLAPVIAEELLEVLAALRLLAEERNALVLAQAAHAVRALNAVGLTPVLLKGAGHLASGLHAHAADRLVGDLDLLVAEEEMPAAVHALAAAGYAVQSPELLHTDGTSRVDVHYPPLAHNDWPLLVELHWALLPGPLGAVLPPNELIARGERISLDRAEAFVLATDDALLYNILHAEARHHAAWAQKAPLWQLYDSLLLARRCTPDVWNQVFRRAPAYTGYIQRHRAILHDLFHAENTRGAALGRWAAWRMRHATNRDGIGRADAALCAAVAALAGEAESVGRQLRDPARRGELCRKLIAPGAYSRRMRNVIARVRKALAS